MRKNLQVGSLQSLLDAFSTVRQNEIPLRISASERRQSLHCRYMTGGRGAYAGDGRVRRLLDASFSTIETDVPD